MYQEQVYKIKSYISKIEKEIYKEDLINLPRILDGDPYKFIRQNLSLQYRRNNGCFFSNQKLATEVFKLAKDYMTPQSRIVDPACGLGDLLLMFAKKIGVRDNLNDTIKEWNKLLVGYDIQEFFVKLTKIRMILLSKFLLKDNSIHNYNLLDLLTNIERYDSFNKHLNLNKEDIIVINPPFGSTKSTAFGEWGGGSLQKAAIFLEKIILSAPEGQNIIAILPDVLRSGTRYDKWRTFVSNNTKIKKLVLYGKFDRYTNVDIFLIHLEKQNVNKNYTFNWNRVRNYLDIVGAHFEAKIGPVVPFRIRNNNRTTKYIKVKNAIPWREVQSFGKINFDGTIYRAPFVVIRRTSNPKDISRIVPTLVLKKGSYAVENHLIILLPKDNSIQTCMALIDRLKDIRTNIWFNKFIRCRHLTKKSILNLPWWNNDE